MAERKEDELETIRDPGAPFIYFEEAPTSGIAAGAIKVELSSTVLIPSGSGVRTAKVLNAHLRCSPLAAISLINALQGALAMLEAQNSQQEPPEGPLN